MNVEVLKKFRASSYAVSIVYIIVGLIMLLNPNFISDAVNYVIGVLIIIYGVIYSISLYQKRETELYGKFDFLAGILCISFGLFLIVHKDILFSLIPFCAGVILLMDGITAIIKSFSLKKLEYTKWWIDLVIGFIFLAFAIYIIVNAKAISETLIRIIGGLLIFDAIVDFINVLMIKRRIEKVKVIETSIVEKN